jgi:dihydropteroate synthase
VATRALAAGATILNAADGMQHEAMWKVAAQHEVPIVVPFLSGPDPRSMSMVHRDPVETIANFFETRLADADRYGLRHRCILDPGTGFAPPNWPWEQRYLYQREIYTRLGELRRFGLPLYIALPWKRSDQHDELLELVVRQQPEYGRVHHPERVRLIEARLGLG